MNTTPQRVWTAAQLRDIERRWQTETLPEIAADIGVPLGTLKSLLSRHGIRCPARNPKARRRRFGPVSRQERDERRRWYRMYHRLRLDGVGASDAVAELRRQGCELSHHQLISGWCHYRRTLRH